MICTFFGHRDTPQEIELYLKPILIDLIENKNINTFYVGNQGNFDKIVKKTLHQLKTDYPYINHTIVLAYLSPKIDDFTNTIFPECLEQVPPKYAISKRNYWMIQNSDYVVCYVKHKIGGAAHFKEYSEKQGKIVIEL